MSFKEVMACNCMSHFEVVRNHKATSFNVPTVPTILHIILCLNVLPMQSPLLLLLADYVIQNRCT